MELNNIAIAIIFFILGNISGYCLHRFASKETFNFNSDQRINWLIIVVSVVWIISVLYDMASPVYETSPLIHGIMGAIVGFFFWRPNK